MSQEVTVPSAGESVTSATIGVWHKKDGEQVAKGEVIVTLETDKVSQDLEAEADGVLSIVVGEGEDVGIGDVIARIGEAEESGDGGKSEGGDKEKEKEKKEKDKEKKKEEESAGSGEKEKDQSKDGNKQPTEIKSSAPKQEAKGKESGESRNLPDLTLLAGRTGGQADKSEAKPASGGGGQGDSSRVTRKKLSPLRRKIANHLVNAQQEAAILTTFNECDMSGVMGLRRELQEGFVARHGIKLGFMSFFVKAVVDALQSVPQINSRLEGNELVSQHYYDIGVAVGTDKGLVVPVIRDAERKTFAEIEKDIGAYAAKAKEGKLTLDDLQGGVFTISNGGVYGSLLSTPILNPPQSAILGMHTIQERPVAVNGKVEIRPMMYLALSYDHRIVDGKEAVTFLSRVKLSIEQPTRLLVGV